MTRGYAVASGLDADGLALGLAPALTPAGDQAHPSFFHGFATQPQVLARGLVTLADVTATRYFNYVPSNLRDPVLTAQGDRLRAECFSACNAVYARLDLLGGGFDGGDIAHGTTNVDLGTEMRRLLTGVTRSELLHLDVGSTGMTTSTPTNTATERPVQMPARWIRALGNVAEMHAGLGTSFSLDAARAKAFLATLPAATAQHRSGWLTPTRAGVRITPRGSAGAVHVHGLNRLAAAKRMLTHVTGLTVHGPTSGEIGPAVVTFDLPHARLVLGLTDEVWRGHSGEGALLTALAGEDVLADAALVSALLSFEPVIDVARLAREADLSTTRVRGALAVLASSGRVGWDLHDQAWFHRELPDDPDRVLGDNPRLVGARRLVAADAVRLRAPEEWEVHPPDGSAPHLVGHDLGRWRCTCTWYLNHGDSRGPCKHVLAVQVADHPTVPGNQENP